MNSTLFIWIPVIAIYFFLQENRRNIEVPVKTISPESVYPVNRESEILLNGLWKFKYIPGGEIPNTYKNFYKPGFDADHWENIYVPSNWEMEGKAEPRYGRNLEEGTGLYRTTFILPEKFVGEKIFVRFESVLYAYELYVNGEYAGKWESAFNSRQFDITPFINTDSLNLIAVKVFTHTPKETHLFDMSDGWSLSGIFRDVVLFSVPKVFFSDLVFKSKVLPDSSAQLYFDALIRRAPGTDLNKKYSVNAVLGSPEGTELFLFSLSLDFNDKQEAVIIENTTIQSPVLWTAETPYLYNFKMTLYEGDQVLQSIIKKIGIREISIEDGILKLNYTPVKLKGVNMHEIHPERGRALTDKDRKKDLILAKKANINFIRTSHYPHHPRFFEMCDSMGFYVICEIPFNFSPQGVSENLKYLPDLLCRAEATVFRYKNHPSIIAWSVGNENHNAEIYKKVAEYVAEKDPTRPRCFPQAPTVFAKEWKTTPDIFNVLAPHYLLPEQLDSLACKSRRPVIMTEYAHSLGLSTENLEDNWKVILRHPNLAGGALWMWTDQGIQRKRTVEEFLAEECTEGIWLDSTTYFDGFNVNGTDGIVYSNRHPQADYWLARRVYSPIWVDTLTVNTQPGMQNIRFEVENRLDFISLKGFTCRWTLNHYTEKIDSGKFNLTNLPKSKIFYEIETVIPEKFPNEFFLTLHFYNRKNLKCFETNIQILSSSLTTDYYQSGIVGQNKLPPVEVKTEDGIIYLLSKYIVFCIENDGNILLKNFNTGNILLNDKPVLRVGRKPTITLKYQGERYQNKGWFKDNFYWNPYLLFNPELISRKANKVGDNYQIITTYRWHREEKGDEYIEGQVAFEVFPDGCVACKYKLIPHNVSGIFTELGLGFRLPEDISVFSWLGEGPFVSVPGKTKYNTRDLWTLHKDDIRFNGNRAKTDVALFFKNEKKFSIGFIGRESDFGIELVDNRMVFTDNLIVSGFGTKVNFTRYFCEASKIKSLSGGFRLTANRESLMLPEQVFSLPPVNEMTIEKPFLKSYGF